jgi:hypothetical protein
MEEEQELEAQDILAKSIAWINTHPNATIGDVPDDLLDAWIDPSYGGSEEDEMPGLPSPEPSRLAMSVFLYAFLEKRRGNKKQIEIPEDEIFSHYHDWQIKLHLRSLTDHFYFSVKKKGIPLFSFDPNEEITVKRKPNKG